MKLTITKSLIIGTLFLASGLLAQEVTEYERVYYLNPETFDGPEYGIIIKNVVAQNDHCKFGLKLTNNTNDYLVYIPKESTFNYSFGDKHPSQKEFMIQPNGSKSKTLKVDGGDQFLQKSFKVNFDGLYKIPVDGKVAEVSDFKLPASTNSFTSGNFKVSLKKYDASTREAKAIFECTYLGDDVALVSPAQLSVTATRKKSDELVTYANDYKKSDAVLLRKGDKTKITAVFHIPGKIVDMQFATMHIVWNDTFMETTQTPLNSAGMEFVMNEPLTKEKN